MAKRKRTKKTTTRIKRTRGGMSGFGGAKGAMSELMPILTIVAGQKIGKLLGPQLNKIEMFKDKVDADGKVSPNMLRGGVVAAVGVGGAMFAKNPMLKGIMIGVASEGIDQTITTLVPSIGAIGDDDVLNIMDDIRIEDQVYIGANPDQVNIGNILNNLDEAGNMDY